MANGTAGARDYTLTMCECEHACHFPVKHSDGKKRYSTLSPNGNPSHKYGRKFCAWFVKPTQTNWGTFNLCQDCAGDCHGHS